MGDLNQSLPHAFVDLSTDTHDVGCKYEFTLIQSVSLSTLLLTFWNTENQSESSEKLNTDGFVSRLCAS